MTKIVIWCRHHGDNIIGLGPKIPWRIPSDTLRFRNLTLGKTIVVGKNTYESFPNHNLPNRKIIVVSADECVLSDSDNHTVIHNLKDLENYDDDLYISGGASIYAAFFTTSSLMPDIVVDSVYMGDITIDAEPIITVTRSVEVMYKEYTALASYDLDNVRTTLWVRKNTAVNQTVLDSINKYLATEGK